MFQSKGPQTARSIICARMWKVYGALSLDERLRSVPQSAAIFHVQPAASALIIRSSQNPSESVRICEDLQGSPTTREEGPEGHGSSCPAMPSYAQLCPAMPSYAQLCPAMPSYAQLCPAMPSRPARLESRWIGVRPGPGCDGGNGTRVASVLGSRPYSCHFTRSRLATVVPMGSAVRRLIPD